MRQGADAERLELHLAARAEFLAAHKLTEQLHQQIETLVNVELPQLRTAEATAVFNLRMANSDLKHALFLEEEAVRERAEAAEFAAARGCGCGSDGEGAARTLAQS